jgi:serine protease Do
MSPIELHRLRLFMIAALFIAVPGTNFAQSLPLSVSLPRNRFRSGAETLQAFSPISAATRHSIVKFNVDGETVAFGTIVGTNGLALTKASELRKGKLTCWLATDEEAEAELLETDLEEDVAFVRVHAKGLKPIQWASERVAIGEWAITPGIGQTPYAVGIISALPRGIRPPRALMGIQFDFSTSLPKIAELLPGLGAEQAGLKVGDVILALNDEVVSNREQVITIVGDHRDGQSIKVGVQRAGIHFEAAVQLKVPKPGQLGRRASAERRLAQLEGDVSQRAGGFEQVLEHDTVLPPWLCGGPLVNLDGKAIGLNIARAGRVSTYALSARLVNQLVKNFEAEQTR